MPSPYSSIDASMEESNETMEIQRLGIIRKENAECGQTVIYEISRKDL